MTIEHWAILILGAVSVLLLVTVAKQNRDLERMAENLDTVHCWADFWRRLAGDLMRDNALLAGEQEPKTQSVRVRKPAASTFPAVDVVDLKHKTVTRLWLN